MTELSTRISDAEREQMVISLRDHLLAGRLTLEEFSQRVDSAYRARVKEDLLRVADGLPATISASPAARRKPSRLTSALFGHVVRRGRLRLRRRTLVISVFADVDIDLREAEIDYPITALNILAVFGNVDIYVPEGVIVDVRGFTLFGHRREWGHEVAHVGAPIVHVRSLGYFGTLDVWRVPRGMHGTYGEMISQLKSRQRKLPRLPA